MTRNRSSIYYMNDQLTLNFPPTNDRPHQIVQVWNGHMFEPYPNVYRSFEEAAAVRDGMVEDLMELRGRPGDTYYDWWTPWEVTPCGAIALGAPKAGGRDVHELLVRPV